MKEKEKTMPNDNRRRPVHGHDPEHARQEALRARETLQQRSGREGARQHRTASSGTSRQVSSAADRHSSSHNSAHLAEKRFPTTPAISRFAARKCYLQEVASSGTASGSLSFPHAPAPQKGSRGSSTPESPSRSRSKKKPRRKLPQLKQLKNLFLLPSA